MKNWAIIIPIALSTLYLIVHQLSQPPTFLKPKIFVLGLSKTGTTSVGNALALLGYKRIGWKDIRSRHLVHTFIHGDYRALIEQTRYFDAFEDLPWPFMYREMAEMYPDAKFVLSLRKDEQTWLRSLRRHMGRGWWEPAEFFYGAQFVDGNEDVVLQAYRNHTANVREYFRDMPERYAELVIDDGDANWVALCSVAECPDGLLPLLEFPKSNTVADWRDGEIITYPRNLAVWMIARLEELTEDLYYKRAWRVVNFMLERIWDLISTLELICCDWYFKLVVRNQKPFLQLSK